MLKVNPFQFKFTDSERTDDSAKAYARGMFGKKDVSNVYMLKSQYPDKLLRVINLLTIDIHSISNVVFNKSHVSLIYLSQLSNIVLQSLQQVVERSR